MRKMNAKSVQGLHGPPHAEKDRKKRFPPMTTAPTDTKAADDERLMAALALALVDKPRAPLQELAKAVGVSKA